MSPPGQSRGPADQDRTPRSGKGKHAEAQHTDEPGLWQLVTLLDGVEDRSTHHFKLVAFCPFHEGDRRNLVIEFKATRQSIRPILLAGCEVCRFRDGETVNLGRLAEHYGLTIAQVMWRAEDLESYVPPAKSRPPAPVPEMAAVEWWCDYLNFFEDVPQYLYNERLLTPETVKHYRIGFHDYRRRYTLPVLNEAGELVSVRYYDPDPPSGVPKMIMHTGCPASLYPFPPLGERPGVLVCEGEWDCLLLRQLGFDAYTSTAGAGTFFDEWVPMFKDRHVAFIFDCDEPGRDSAIAHAAKVRPVAKTVRVVDLDPARDDKWDVTDWFRSGRTVEELRRLILSVSPLGEVGV